MTNDKKYHKVESSKIQPGEFLVLTYCVKVKRCVGSDEFLVEDLHNNNSEIGVRGAALIDRSHSTDQFAEEEKVSMTHAAELLVSSHGHPFTVCYDKADGTERILKGRLIVPEPLLGRSKCEDFEADAKNRMRLVDHRTIKWLILDGVKYIVK